MKKGDCFSFYLFRTQYEYPDRPTRHYIRIYVFKWIFKCPLGLFSNIKRYQIPRQIWLESGYQKRFIKTVLTHSFLLAANSCRWLAARITISIMTFFHWANYPQLPALTNHHPSIRNIADAKRTGRCCVAIRFLLSNLFWSGYKERFIQTIKHFVAMQNFHNQFVALYTLYLSSQYLPPSPGTQ